MAEKLIDGWRSRRAPDGGVRRAAPVPEGFEYYEDETGGHVSRPKSKWRGVHYTLVKPLNAKAVESGLPIVLEPGDSLTALGKENDPQMIVGNWPQIEAIAPDDTVRLGFNSGKTDKLRLGDPPRYEGLFLARAKDFFDSVAEVDNLPPSMASIRQRWQQCRESWLNRLAAKKFLQGEVLLVNQDFRAQSENHHSGTYSVIPAGTKIEVEQVWPNVIHFAPLPPEGHESEYNEYNSPSFPAIGGGSPKGEGAWRAYRFSVSPRKLAQVTTQVSPGKEPPPDPDAVKSNGETDGLYSEWSSLFATDELVRWYLEQLSEGLPAARGWDKQPWMLQDTEFAESYASSPNPEEWFKNIQAQGLESKLEDVLREKAYEDTDGQDDQLERFNEDLTNLMETVNPGEPKVWRVNLRGFGWMKEDADGTIEADTGADLIQKVLPNTENSFRVYKEGRGIKINNAHHDAPMGGEMYYITPFDAPPPNPEPTPPEAQMAVAPELYDRPSTDPLSGQETPSLREYHEQRRERSRPKDMPQPKTKFTPEQLNEAPSRPGEVGVVDPNDRQVKIDKLLDRFNAETDPVKKQQIQEQLKSLRAFKALWMTRQSVGKNQGPERQSFQSAWKRKAQDEMVFYHGSPSGDLRGGSYGLHLGTYKAAKQALEARIGIPAEGEWDGTREYGKTLLAGHKTMVAKGLSQTGFNVGMPEEDYYPNGGAMYSDGSQIPLTVRPAILAYRLVGPMSNTPYNPYDDFKANGMMAGQIKQNRARRGYYYQNVSEDEGSISVVVPSEAHLERVASAKNSGAGQRQSLLSVWTKKASIMTYEQLNKIVEEGKKDRNPYNSLCPQCGKAAQAAERCRDGMVWHYADGDDTHYPKDKVHEWRRSQGMKKKRTGILSLLGSWKRRAYGFPEHWPDQVKAFMQAVWDQTQGHPFGRNQRIWDNDVILEVAPWQGGPDREYPWVITLKWLQSMTPGRGDATRAMEWLTGLADEYGVFLDLQAKPTGEPKIPKKKLVDFYKGQGFERGDRGGPADLTRQPKSGEIGRRWRQRRAEAMTIIGSVDHRDKERPVYVPTAELEQWKKMRASVNSKDPTDPAIMPEWRSFQAFEEKLIKDASARIDPAWPAWSAEQQKTGKPYVDRLSTDIQRIFEYYGMEMDDPTQFEAPKPRTIPAPAEAPDEAKLREVVFSFFDQNGIAQLSPNAAADLMMNMAVVLNKDMGMSMDQAKQKLTTLLIEYGGGGPENTHLNSLNRRWLQRRAAETPVPQPRPITPESVDEIRGIAEQVRGGVLKCEPASAQCTRMSIGLADALRKVGFDAAVTHGSFVVGGGKEFEHSWVEVWGPDKVSSLIVDVTADQFNGLGGEDAPPILIEDGSGPHPRYVAVVSDVFELGEREQRDIGEAFGSIRGHWLRRTGRIVKEDGTYKVESEKGKNLGSGYETEGEAEKRLQQVEYFKHKGSIRDRWQRRRAAEEKLPRLAWYSSELGTRIDAFVQNAAMGPLWRVFSTGPDGKSKEFAAIPAIRVDASQTDPSKPGYNESKPFTAGVGKFDDQRVLQVAMKLMDVLGRDVKIKGFDQGAVKWQPVDVEQEQSLKKQRGPDFEDFWKSAHVKDEIVNLLSGGVEGSKQYEEEPGRYTYGISFEGSDMDNIAKFFGIETPEPEDDLGDLSEDIEGFGEDLVSGLPGTWGLPGQLGFGWFGESGEMALYYMWDDDDIAEFAEKGTPQVPQTAADVIPMDPKAEIDKLLEMYQTITDPEEKARVERKIERLRQRGAILRRWKRRAASPLRPVVIPPELEGKLFHYTINYAKTTYESVQQGDFSETGCEDDGDGTMAEIVSMARNLGIEANGKSNKTGWWESSAATESYATGETIQYSLHVKDISDSEFSLINQLLGGPPTDTPETVEQVKSVDPEAEFDRLIKQRDLGRITPEQFEEKSRRLFGFRSMWMMRRAASDLNAMVGLYIKTALWSSHDDEGNNLDDSAYSDYQVDEPSMEAAIADCRSFMEKAGPLLDGLDMGRVGHDFWLTRCGHGAGFWDGDYEEEVGKALTKLSEEFGDVHIVTDPPGGGVEGKFRFKNYVADQRRFEAAILQRLQEGPSFISEDGHELDTDVLPEDTQSLAVTINKMLLFKQIKFNDVTGNFSLGDGVKGHAPAAEPQPQPVQDRQSQIDALLDQLGPETDPAKKQQIEQQIRSLRASLRGRWLVRRAAKPVTDEWMRYRIAAHLREQLFLNRTEEIVVDKERLLRDLIDKTSHALIEVRSMPKFFNDALVSLATYGIIDIVGDTVVIDKKKSSAALNSVADDFFPPGIPAFTVEQGKRQMESLVKRFEGNKESPVAYGECRNCSQDLHQGRHGFLDCVSECAARNMAPRIFANMTAEEQKRTPSRPGGMDVQDVSVVDPEAELSRLLKLKDSGEITPEQFQEKSRRLFGSLLSKVKEASTDVDLLNAAIKAHKWALTQTPVGSGPIPWLDEMEAAISKAYSEFGKRPPWESENPPPEVVDAVVVPERKMIGFGSAIDRWMRRRAKNGEQKLLRELVCIVIGDDSGKLNEAVLPAGTVVGVQPWSTDRLIYFYSPFYSRIIVRGKVMKSNQYAAGVQDFRAATDIGYGEGTGYEHGPECFCDECMAKDDMTTHRCPSCGSRECPGDGHSIDCRKPGTMTLKDVPVETRDSLLDKFNRGEIDEETLRRRMKQISSSVFNRWMLRRAANEEEIVTVYDGVRGWESASKPGEKTPKSYVIPNGMKLRVIRKFRLGHGGNPMLAEVEIIGPDRRWPSDWPRRLVVRIGDVGSIGVVPAPSKRDPIKQLEDALVDILRAGPKTMYIEDWVKAIGENPDDELSEARAIQVFDILRNRKVIDFNMDINTGMVKAWMVGVAAPSSTESIPGMSEADRQKRIDALLERLNAEADPAKKDQIKQQINSLRASIFDYWLLRLAAYKDWSPSFLFDPRENPVPFPKPGQFSGLWISGAQGCEDDLDQLWQFVQNDSDLYRAAWAQFEKIPKVKEGGLVELQPVSQHPEVIEFLKQHFNEINVKYVYPTWGKASMEPGHEGDPFYSGQQWKGQAKDVIRILGSIYGEERGRMELEKFLARLKPGEQEDFVEEAGRGDFEDFMSGFQEIIDKSKGVTRVKPSPKTEMRSEDVQALPELDVKEKTDQLLDQLSKETDPGKKRKIEQQLRSLQASVRGRWALRRAQFSEPPEPKPGGIKECEHHWPGKGQGERGWCGRCGLGSNR